jgi:hypothetical protein
MRILIRHLALALILTAAVAARADEQSPAGESAKNQKGEAKRHLWTAEVALERARLGLQGLYALASDTEGAFDSSHGTSLLGGAQRDVKMAAAHLQHLTSVPAKDPAAETQLTKVQTQLARLQTELRSLEAPVRGEPSAQLPPGSGGDTGVGSAGAPPSKKPTSGQAALKAQVKDSYRSLETATGDFKKLASEYGVTTNLPTP